MERKPFIGEMNRKIQIVKLDMVQNTTGEQKPTDVIVAEPFAAMVNGAGGETVEGKVRHIFDRVYTIRVNKLVKAGGTKLVLIDDGERFSIEHVNLIGRSHLQILVNRYE